MPAGHALLASWRRTDVPGGCKHNVGDYPAEVIMEQGKMVAQQHRCNGCHIILRTERK